MCLNALTLSPSAPFTFRFRLFLSFYVPDLRYSPASHSFCLLYRKIKLAHELAAAFESRRGEVSSPNPGRRLTEVSEYAAKQYGQSYHLSWFQQLMYCTSVLGRLHFRNKENFLMCVKCAFTLSALVHVYPCNSPVSLPAVLMMCTLCACPRSPMLNQSVVNALIAGEHVVWLLFEST